jgi:hypothetical protein
MTNSEQIEMAIQAAIAGCKELQIDYRREGDRIVQPHALFRRNDGRVFIDAVQIAGVSSGGAPEGWKQFEVSEISAATVLESGFDLASEYDPSADRYKAGLIQGVA